MKNKTKIALAFVTGVLITALLSKPFYSLSWIVLKNAVLVCM